MNLTRTNGDGCAIGKIVTERRPGQQAALRARFRVRTGDVETRNQTQEAKQVPLSGKHTPGMHGKPRALRRTINTVYFSTAKPRARSVNCADELDYRQR